MPETVGLVSGIAAAAVLLGLNQSLDLLDRWRRRRARLRKRASER